MSGVAVGAHVSIAGGFIEAFKRAKEIDATALQIFAKSPRSAASRKVTAAESKEVAEFTKRYPLSGVIHASYLLNFAQKMDERHYQYRSLAEDLENAEALGLGGVVVHLGKTKEGDLSEAIKTYAHNIAHIVNNSKTKKVRLLLENTAGQGSEFGYRFEEWGQTLDLIKEKLKDRKRIGVCLDTAHSFSGGYDWSNKKTLEESLVLFDKHVGFKNLGCVHLNDSKKPLSARVDRHEDIGKGMIGAPGLKLLVKKILQSKKDIPFILETPETSILYKEQINAVRKWLD